MFCVVAVQFSSLEPGQAARKTIWAGKAMVSTWEGSKAVLPANLLVHWGGHWGPVMCVNKQNPSQCWWRTYMCQTPRSAFPISISFHPTYEEAWLLPSFSQREMETWALGNSQEGAGLNHRGAEIQTQQSHSAACAPVRAADSRCHKGWSRGHKSRGGSQKSIQPHSYHTTRRLIKTALCFQLIRVNIIDSSQFPKLWAISRGKEITQPKGQTLKNTAVKCLQNGTD